MHVSHKTVEGRAHFPVGVNAIVMRDGELLLGKRKYPHYHDGGWGLPGGHLEYGEKLIDAVARELQEETGLKSKKFSFLVADNDTRGDGFHYIHFGFRAEEVSGEPQVMEPEKCYGWEWFPLTALPEPLFFGHQKMLRAIQQKLIFIE